MPLRNSSLRIFLRMCLVVLCLAALTAGCLAFFVAVTTSFGPESSTNKAEWAFLQGVEWDHRAMGPAPWLLVEKKGEYCGAGFWSEDAAEHVWVLVKPASDPVKVVPDKTFLVRPGDIDRIMRECPMKKEVGDFLRSHVIPPR